MDNIDEKIEAKLRLMMADYFEFEQIVKGLPSQVNNEMTVVKEEISSLEKALGIVPEIFDAQFKAKMNLLLDTVSQIDTHSKKLENAVNNDTLQNRFDQLFQGANKALSIHAEEVSKSTEKAIGERYLLRYVDFVIYGLICAITGGFVAGLAMWIVLPRIFG